MWPVDRVRSQDRLHMPTPGPTMMSERGGGWKCVAVHPPVQKKRFKDTSGFTGM